MVRKRQGRFFGSVIATLDGDKVREGSGSFGSVIATIDGDKVREGNGSLVL